MAGGSIVSLERVGRALFAVRPKFDPVSYPLYFATVATVFLKVVMFDNGGFTSGNEHPWDAVILCLFPILTASMFRRVGNERLATSIETIFLMVVVGLTAVQLQFPVTAHSPMLVDDLLLRADRAFGFDWLSFSLMFQSPPVWKFLDFSYACFRAEAALVMIYLCTRVSTLEAWKFLTAFVFALLVSVLSLYLFPATGEHVLCGLKPPELPVSGALCDYGGLIEGVRDGSIRTIRSGAWVGLVSFPSFHVAAAVLMQWHLRKSWLLFWPALAINVGMSIAAIVVGSHYFVDILGGLLLAWLCHVLAGYLIARRTRRLKVGKLDPVTAVD